MAGVLILLGGLVMAAAPLAAWFTFSFGPFDASVNGYGSTSADEVFDEPADDQGFTVTSDTSSDEEIDWILGSLADGYVATVLGILVACTGALLVTRALGSIRDGNAAELAARRRGTLALAGLTIGLVGVALVWTVVSYTRVKSDFDSQLSDSVDDDPFAAAFLGGLDFGPGTGMILEGLAILGVGIVAVVALLLTATGARLRVEGVATSAGGPSWAPPPQAATASTPGQHWSPPSGAPAPGPPGWGPATGAAPPPGGPAPDATAPPPVPGRAPQPTPPPGTPGTPGTWPPPPSGPPTGPG